MPFFDLLFASLTSQFGFGILAAILGLFIFIVFTGFWGLDIVYSSALAFIPFVIYIINLGNQFFWLFGIIAMVYGIILWASFKGLLGR